MLDKNTRMPIIDPLMMALKSRRVIIALVTLLVGMLTLAIPELTHVRGELLTLLITLALAVIGGYSVEDAATAARQTDPTRSEAELRQLVREVINGVLDEIDLRE